MERLTKVFHRREKSSRDVNTGISSVDIPPPPPVPDSEERHVSKKRSMRSVRRLSRRKTSETPQHNGKAPSEPLPASLAARSAASAAMRSTNQRLDAEEQGLFSDFGQMSVRDHSRRLSEQGIPVRQLRKSSAHRSSAEQSNDASTSRYTRPSSAVYQPTVPHSHTVMNAEVRQHSLTRKPDLQNLRPADNRRNGSLSADDRIAGLNPARHGSLKSKAHKPLPKSPSDKFEAEMEADRRMPKKTDSGHEDAGLVKQDYLVSDSKTPVDLNGIVDLSNTEDTTMHKAYAPAVTHETIRQDVHNVRIEEITREIHTHDVYHRVLPIIDFEILPARHFVPAEGGYVEISADEVPGGAADSAQELLQQAVASLATRNMGAPVLPTRFSARPFEGTEGDYREYTTAEGIKRTEQWWVHPPTWEVGPGQDNTIRVDQVIANTGSMKTTSVASNVIGISPLLAQQRAKGVVDINGHPASSGVVRPAAVPGTAL